jgi:hypothetical protein
MHLFNRLILAAGCACNALSVQAAACEARSGPMVPAVIELYTSEGCSSCPPADRWLSGLKQAAAQGQVVAQAFHVGYWDYIGWVDRFAAPAHTARQREIAALNDLDTIYTPQLVRNGRDWRDWRRTLLDSRPPAQASIVLRRPEPDAFEAEVVPADPQARWAAYWTVTEHGHASKVTAGENRGERLQHDFVVRQYVSAGRHQGSQRLRLRPLPADAAHPRQVNLVVVEPRTGRPLQALSLACS